MAEVNFRRPIADNPGHVGPIGAGVSGLKIDYGAGYRVYYRLRGKRTIVLLAGGDKHTQAEDIALAFHLVRMLRDQHHDQ